MKVKKLTNGMKKVICTLSTAALVFTNTGMTTFASQSLIGEESTQAEETQQELQTEETKEQVLEEDSDTEDAESILEENVSIEENTTKEQADNEDAENTSVEDVTTKYAATEEAAEQNSETEVEEDTLKSTSSDTIIANGEYKEDGNNITWVIDADGKLTVDGTGDFAPQKYTVDRAPWYEHRADIKTAEIKVENMKNAYGMFRGCSELTEIDLSGFDTSSVTHMGSMFYGCSNLTEIDLSNFDTSNITHMGSMFQNCSSLADIDLSNFNTQNVIDMGSMFWGCSSLTALNLSNFNTQNVTSMNCMFQSCSNLKNIDIDSFKTDRVTNMGSMFYGCSNLTAVDVSGFNTKSVETMRAMFAYCNSLETIDVSNFNTDSVTDMAIMFSNCNSLKAIDVSSFNTQSITNMGSMFYGCSNLTELDLKNFDTRNVMDMSQMFYNCSNLTNLDLSMFNGEKVTDMKNMFGGCSSLTSLDLSGFNAKSVKDLSNIFYGCNQLKTIYTPYNLSETALQSASGTIKLPTGLDYSILITIDGTTSNIEQRFVAEKVKKIFEYGDDLELDDMIVRLYKSDGTVMIIDDYTTNADELDMYESGEKVLNIQYGDLNDTIKLTVLPKTEGENIAEGSYSGITWSISAAEELTVTGTGDFSAVSNDVKRAPWYEYRLDIKFAEINVQNMTDASYMFYGCSNLKKVDLSNFKTDKVANMRGIFYNCNKLRELDLGGFVTTEVTDMSYMFYHCISLAKLDLKNFNTSNVTDMRYMFADCSGLTELNLKSFDTANVTNMYCMFYGCKNLTDLNISSFDTTNVTTMYYMFIDCSSLTNLDVSNFNTANVADMGGMFKGCSSLTTLDVINFNTAVVTNMSDMFYQCSSIKSLNVSSFDTANVTNMKFMFSDCDSLTTLDVSNFNTANVTNMNSMFSSCENLTSLNVSNFNTANVTDMGGMFGWCNNLTNLSVADFDTSNVTNMANMFYSCDLPSLDLRHFNTSKVTDMESMFAFCSTLTSININNFDTANVTDMSGMFNGCTKLTYLNLNGFNTSNVTDMNRMFVGSTGLTDLDISSFNTVNVTSMNDMFLSCNALTKIYTPYNVSVSAQLPSGTWYDSAGNTYTELPTGKDYSVLLAKDKKPDAVARITVKKTKTTYQCGDTISVNDLTVTYYDTDGTQRQLAADEYTTNAATIKTSEAGEQTLTITYNGLTANVILTISAREESSEPEESGSTEGSKTEESSSTENSKTDESSNTTESSSTEENGSTESSSTEESSEPTESSPDETDASPVEWEYPENLNVARTTLTDTDVEVKAKKRIYDGTPYTPDVKVTVKDSKGKKTVLTEGTDYSVRYSKNVDAGDGQVTVKGNGAYTGTVTKTFSITQKPIKKLKTVAGGIIASTNTNATSPENLPIYVYDGTKKLTYDKDYTLTVTGDATKKGKLQVAISTKDGSNYTGTGKDAAKATVTVYETTGKNFKGIINPEDVAFEKTSDASQTYTGKALKPTFKVTVNVDGTPTTLGTKDFSVKYTNNKEAGTAYATITGKGGYVGSVVKTFEITPVSESGGFTLKKEIKAPTYNGKLQKPKVTITSGTKTLKAGKDYRISYSNNLHATPENATNTNKAKITVTGIGNYKGMNGIFYFEIKPLEIRKASVKGTQNNLDITYAKHPLIKGYDYEITEITPDGKKAKVTLTGIGDFTGTVTKKVNTQ